MHLPADHPSADEQPLDIVWRGKTYTLPPAGEWPVDVLEAMEDGKAATFVRSILGPSQWATVKAAGLSVADLSDLGDVIAKAYGFGSQGE